ncbi:MAG: helix-turn-helix transcriptional regulator, partial [Lachnospiraceae bacterium]|nr:helix-turn-helix transcriptional regulator [Lachnospiraceae bacterium]
DDNASSVINEAKLYMSQNFSNPNLMLQDVAKKVNMSNSRFSTVFSQETGQTFTEYLMFLRLNKAKELLRQTNTRSTQIASEVGYNDSHYFSYIFKKNFGLTPSEYRAKYQN